MYKRAQRYRNRLKTDSCSYLATALCAIVAVKNKIVDEAVILCLSASRKGLAHDLTTPLSFVSFFLVGYAVAETILLLVELHPALSNWKINEDKIPHTLFQYRYYNKLLSTIEIMINVMSKYDFFIYPGFAILRFILKSMINRASRKIDSTDLHLLDSILIEVPSEFLFAMAYAHQERAKLCFALSYSSLFQPNLAKNKMFASHFIAQHMFKRLSKPIRQTESGDFLSYASESNLLVDSPFPWDMDVSTTEEGLESNSYLNEDNSKV